MEDLRRPEPRYPDVEVQLSSQDGNSMMIIGRVGAALRKAGVSADIRNQFASEAMSSDYDHVLRTAMEWVSVA